MKIFTPIVEKLHLQIRFNLKTRNVEIKVSICIKYRSITNCEYVDPMLSQYPQYMRFFYSPRKKLPG